jgi:phosphatidylglycerophosphatase A
VNDALVRALASGFGLGRSPVAPGTAGTLVAVPFALLWTQLPPAGALLVLLLSLPLAAYLCDRAEGIDGGHDPGWIVLDEMVGFWFAVAWLPPGWWTYGAAFVLFRLFDILKPPPAGWLDRTLPGGWGILLDDVVAGAYVRLLLGLGQVTGVV